MAGITGVTRTSDYLRLVARDRTVGYKKSGPRRQLLDVPCESLAVAEALVADGVGRIVTTEGHKPFVRFYIL